VKTKTENPNSHCSATINSNTISDVHAFLKLAQRDEQIRKQLQEIKATNKQQSIEQICRIAAAAGCNFTAQEYEKAARARFAASCNNSRQPSDQELVGVAAGTC
jgi:predicted ribosomally synthesized peptide with nif11-like leader